MSVWNKAINPTVSMKQSNYSQNPPPKNMRVQNYAYYVNKLRQNVGWETWIWRQIVTSQRPHTTKKWLPYATEWNPHHCNFLRTPPNRPAWEFDPHGFSPNTVVFPLAAFVLHCDLSQWNEPLPWILEVMISYLLLNLFADGFVGNTCVLHNSSTFLFSLVTTHSKCVDKKKSRTKTAIFLKNFIAYLTLTLYIAAVTS